MSLDFGLILNNFSRHIFCNLSNSLQVKFVSNFIGKPKCSN